MSWFMLGIVPNRSTGGNEMGEVVDFRKTARDFGRTAQSGSLAGAQILFFTGVRYMRHDDALMVAPVSPPQDGSHQGPGQNARKRKQRA